MTDPIKIPKPGKPTVGKQVGKAKPKGAHKIVDGGSGPVTSNSIGGATSVAGSRPYGRQMQGPIYKLTTGLETLPYGGPVQRVKFNYDQTKQQGD